MDEAETLQNEIYCIVTAPFQVSLQNLHDLVQRSNPRSLQQWAGSKPCQIDALAAAVLDGLPVWPYIQDILEQLSKIIAFRDSVLRQNSLLLDHLLTEATKKSDSWQKYSNTCVSILSKSLPSEIPIPASFHCFFQRTVETMTPSSADTIRPVYNLLCGVGPGIFSTLPRETIDKFQKVCRDLLVAPGDHSISLLCLASLARIARGWNHVPCPSVSSRLPTCQQIPYDDDWFQRVLEFFNAKRAGKTLQLIAVFVNQACSINIDVPVIKSLEILTLAKDVVESVEKSELKKWLQVKTGYQMVSKLDKKIEGLEPQPELQAAVKALSFRMSLCDSKETPSIAARLCWDVVARCIRMERPDCAADLLEHPAIRPDESIMASINQDTVNCILNTSIHVASGIMGESRTQFLTIFSLNSLIKFLDHAVQASTSTRLKLQKILSAIDSSSNWKRLATFMGKERIHTCEPKDICEPSLVTMRTSLAISICTLFVRASAQLSENITMTSAASPLNVLRHLASLSCSSSCKAMVPTRAKPRVSILEIGSTPQTDSPSRDWRDRLADDLRIDSVRSQETIIRFVGEVFRDYEIRNANVEQPLREALQKLQQVQAELQASKTTNGELKSQVSEVVATANTLASEKAGLERMLNGVRIELETLTEDLRAAQENESAAQEDADRAAKNAENQVKLKELEFLAATAAKDETIEIQQRELARLDGELRESKYRLEDANLENRQISERLKVLDQRTQSQETDLDELRKSSAAHREKISALELDNEPLASKIEDLNDLLAKANACCETLQSENQDLRKDKTQALENQRRFHQQELRKADVEANERLCLKDQQIDGLNAALTKAERDASIELRSKNVKISTLQSQIEELQAKEEAIKNLFVDKKTRNTETRRTPHRHSHLELGTPHADSIAPRPAIGGYDGPCDSSSSSNSGPTPKRLRSHRTAGTPSRRMVRFRSVNSSYRPPSRRPLEESTVNGEKTPIRASGSQRKNAAMKSMEDLGLGDLENISFTDGSVFTSSESRKHDSSPEKLVTRADEETADEL